MTNVVGLQTDDAGNIGQNSSAHVARVVGLQTDAVVVTETRFNVVVFAYLVAHALSNAMYLTLDSVSRYNSCVDPNTDYINIMNPITLTTISWKTSFFL